MAIEGRICPVCTGSVAMERDAKGKLVCPACGAVVDSAAESVLSTQPGAILAGALPFSAGFLKDYEPVGFLGRGAMGTVWLMRQVKLPRLVAVKSVVDGSLSKDVERRLHKEAQVLARLNHPNILQIYDVGVDGAVPYMVSEYVEGETLAARMKRDPPLLLSQALRIAIQVLDGLRAAHKDGIVHRDIKPANVFLTQAGKPKIGDFGLAKSQGASSGTMAGRIVGTPAYMSPEQCRSAVATPASDLYSVGVMLFEMVAGARPFPGPDLFDFLRQHTDATAPRLELYRPDAPDALDALVARALEKDPAARPASAAEMRKALQEVYRGLSSDRARTPGREATPSRAGPTSRPDEAPAPGVVLANRYELVRLLGQGGMGQVWLATDRARDHATIALKLLPPELWRDPEARANIVQEANLSLKLTHPGIVRLMNLEPAEAPFLVMEYVDGVTLAEELARRKLAGRGPMSPAEALAILAPVAGALDHAHAHGVLHRDVKPANVLLETDEGGARASVKLGDFGIAAELSGFRTRQTGLVPAGTLAYMSPEQLNCQKLDARSDVYALGATLYQMLALAPPFAGGDVARAIESAPVPRPDGVDDAVARVLERVLAKKRNDRPQTAGALCAELARAIEGGEGRALPLWLPVALAGVAGAAFWYVVPEAPRPAPVSVWSAPPAPPSRSPAPRPSVVRSVAPSPSPSPSPSPKPSPSPSPSPSPTSPTSPPPLSALDQAARDAALAKALARFRSGEFEPALQLYREAAYIDPNHAETHRKIGQCYLKLDQTEAALRALERAYALAPADPLTLNTFAVALTKAGVADRAEGIARRALEIEQRDPNLWDTLGQALLRRGRDGEARQAFRRALDLDPEHPEAGEALKKLGR